MVVLKNRLLFRGIFYAVFQLVGRLLGLKVYQTARIFPVFQQMNHGIGRPLALIAAGSSNVVGGQFLFMKTSGRSIDDMTVLAPAAMKVAFGENPKTNYSSMNVVPSTRMSVAALLRQELTAAAAYRAKKENAQKNGDTFESDFTKECWLPGTAGRRLG